MGKQKDIPNGSPLSSAQKIALSLYRRIVGADPDRLSVEEKPDVVWAVSFEGKSFVCIKRGPDKMFTVDICFGGKRSFPHVFLETSSVAEVVQCLYRRALADFGVHSVAPPASISIEGIHAVIDRKERELARERKELDARQISLATAEAKYSEKLRELENLQSAITLVGQVVK